jgi:hypothetical protein
VSTRVEPVGELRYRGRIKVSPYRRGTYLGDEYLESLIERALRERYQFGLGWSGHAVVSIVFYEQPPADDAEA